MAADPKDGAEQLVYANWSRYRAGAFDLALDFGYNAKPEDGPPETYPVRIVMSWEHALIFSQLLQDAIKGYQGQVGDIRQLAEIEGDNDSPDKDD